MSEFVGVPADQVDAVWSETAPLVKKALNGDYEIDDVREAIATGTMNLCLSVNGGEIEAACVSQIQQYPRARVWFILFLAGRDMTSWLPFSEYVETAARNAGCRKIEAFARPGWERVSGWKKTRILLEKEL